MPVTTDQWLPLFPLNTLLFPDGVLPLRVFETRYVDMVRERMKANLPFGVVAILSGAEVGAAALPHEVGTLAAITEWDMPEFGVLLILTRGGARFKILETRTLPSKLIEAKVALMAADPVVDGGETLSVCSKVLQVVIDDLQRRADERDSEQVIKAFAEPFQFDDVAWVANRWCEMLPIALEEKQQLLEMTDPNLRLQTVQRYLKENRII